MARGSHGSDSACSPTSVSRQERSRPFARSFRDSEEERTMSRPHWAIACVPRSADVSGRTARTN